MSLCRSGTNRESLCVREAKIYKVLSPFWRDLVCWMTVVAHLITQRNVFCYWNAATSPLPPSRCSIVCDWASCRLRCWDWHWSGVAGEECWDSSWSGDRLSSSAVACVCQTNEIERGPCQKRISQHQKPQTCLSIAGQKQLTESVTPFHNTTTCIMWIL